MKQSLEDPHVILASSSPRRRRLLTQAGLIFTVVPSHFDEHSVSLSSPEQYVKTLAESKGNVVSKAYPSSWVISADTIVLIDNDILGKPESDDDAKTMLQRLSNTTHQVITGYSVRCRSKGKKTSQAVVTNVVFKSLSDREIDWYVQTKEPFNKAGGYAVQGLGCCFVKKINGSYTNVVGLPVCEVTAYLAEHGVLNRT